MTLREKVKEKQKILREEYGGMMSMKDLCRELGMTRITARKWAQENGIGNIVGNRLRFETDEVARLIVNGRGMW